MAAAHARTQITTLLPKRSLAIKALAAALAPLARVRAGGVCHCEAVLFVGGATPALRVGVYRVAAPGEPPPETGGSLQRFLTQTVPVVGPMPDGVRLAGVAAAVGPALHVRARACVRTHTHARTHARAQLIHAFVYLVAGDAATDAAVVLPGDDGRLQVRPAHVRPPARTRDAAHRTRQYTSGATPHTVKAWGGSLITRLAVHIRATGVLLSGGLHPPSGVWHFVLAPPTNATDDYS